METTITHDGEMFKLTAENFSYWKPMMEDHLYCKDLYEPITKADKPEGKPEKDWELLNRKAVAMIRKYIDQSLFEHVSTYTNAYQLWEKLESMIQKKTPQNKAHLVRRLVKSEYKDGQSMIEHLNSFKGLVNKLTKIEMKIDDELQACLLLSSLPESWDTLVVTLSNSAPEGKLTMDAVADSLLNEEARRKERGTTQSEAHIAENRGRSEFHGRNKNKGRDKSRGRSKSHSRITCYYCGKPGHKKSECRNLKRDQKNGTVKPDQVDPRKKEEQNTTAVAVKEESDVFFIGDDNYLNLTYDDNIWIVDSGASFHITPHEWLFTSYQKGNFGTVKMGNQVTSKIIGIGDVHLKTNTGCKLILKDVRHVPDMRLNLISAGKLDDAGLVNQFGSGKWKLTNGNMVIARGKKEGSLYLTRGCLRDEANVVHDDSVLELWHKRLGHISEKGLQILAQKELIPEVKGKTLEPCIDCLAGKQHRVSFYRSNRPSRRKHILDLVHTDVCSMTEKSLGGALYFVTFIDDHSRKVWVYLLKTKDNVLAAFKEFHAMVERQTNKKLKCVRADNGGEYCGPFEEYCKTFGIRLEKTPPKTPQLNGVAERMNRTIEERVRCMISHAKLSKSFWGEAVKTAVDIINLSPSGPLNKGIPDEVWSGKKISYDHLKVFGCLAFVHIPKDERAKLDSKTKQCIYLGSPKNEFGYRLWDPVKRKIIRSRDVIFFEDQTIEDLKQAEKSRPKQIIYSDPAPSSVMQDAGGRQEEEPNHNGLQRQHEVTEQSIEEPSLHEQSQSNEEMTDETNATTQPPLRRSTRERRASTRYPRDEYVVIADEGEPQSYEQAITSEHKGEWEKAMQEEMQSLHDNHTYDLVELPKGKRALKCKWVYKLKTEEKNSLPRYKARIVVKGCNQKKGIDFDEIFSPVVKMSSIRVVMGLAACLDLEVEQLDVKTTFLHGDLEEEIYMEQPEGFKVAGKEHLVCRLEKSLYGLKQAPRQWYKKFDSFMTQHEFKKTLCDHCVYIKKYAGGDFIILLLYVDDMLIVGQDKKKITALKKALSESFAMKDLGAAQQILGMKVTRDRSKGLLWLSQERYIEKILERFNMHKAKPVSVPLANHFKLSKEHSPKTENEMAEMENVPCSSAVGSLMYAMICTRPDIAYAVGAVSRYLSNPGKQHWAAVKWIFRYLRGTTRRCLCFGKGKPVLKGYTDADMAGDVDSRKSTSGYLITFSGGAVSWQSKLQKCVALSTTEAEFIAATESCKEMIWLKNFLLELGQKQESYDLYCDNQSTIQLAKNSAYHSRSKHIDVRYHWIRDALEAKLLQLNKVHTDDNWSDMLTKAIPTKKFDDCCDGAGMEVLPD